jgi:hypothetical protein
VRGLCLAWLGLARRGRWPGFEGEYPTFGLYVFKGIEFDAALS